MTRVQWQHDSLFSILVSHVQPHDSRVHPHVSHVHSLVFHVHHTSPHASTRLSRSPTCLSRAPTNLSRALTRLSRSPTRLSREPTHYPFVCRRPPLLSQYIIVVPLLGRVELGAHTNLIFFPLCLLRYWTHENFVPLANRRLSFPTSLPGLPVQYVIRI